MPERPDELIYALDERPPWLQLLALGFQHVAVICPYLVMVALVAEAAKLPHAAAQSAIGLAMIAVAFMTVIQSLRLGPVGSGYLCPPVVSAIYLPSSLAAAASFGISAVCGMVDLRRRLRDRGGVPHQPDAKTVSGRGFGRRHHGRRVGDRKDRHRRAVRACCRAQRSNHGVFRDCRLRPCGDDGPRGLGHGIAQAILLADRDSDRIRCGGRVPRFSAELLRGLRGGAFFRRPRPKLLILCVCALLRRAFRDRGTCLGSAGDWRADDLSADERRGMAPPRHAKHRSRHPGRRPRLPCRGLLGSRA